MPTLRQTLNDLAASFASDVLEAIRGASLEDLVGPSAANGRRRLGGAIASSGDGVPLQAPKARRGRSGRLARRSAGDIAQVIESIAGLLRQSPRGLRAEQIRKKLGLEAKELPRPLKEGLDGGKFAKVGQKRATTYFAKGAGAVVSAAPASSGSAAAARAVGGRKAKRGRPAKRAKKAGRARTGRRK
jgi:hypothetical protein